MKRRKINRTTLALLTVVGLTLTLGITLCSAAIASQDNPVPFPDKEIQQYVGKEIGIDVMKEINEFITSKYPDHVSSITFREIEAEEHEGIGPMGEPILWVSVTKLELIEALDYGLDSNPPPESTRRVYSYSGTLSPGVGKWHGNYYLYGTAEFTSDTSWTPSNVPMHIGLLNKDTMYFGYHVYSSSPAYDIIRNWNYPYYYAHCVRNPATNEVNVTFSCSYSYEYI